MKYKIPGKDKISPVGPPCRKKLYDTKEEALDAAAYVSSSRHVRLEVYLCTVCGFWHLTSVKSD